MYSALKAPTFQIQRHQPAELAIVEQQVDAEVVSVDLDPLLASDEGEPAAELQDERLELAEDGVFQVFLQVAVRDAEEIEDVGIIEDHLGRDLIPPRAAPRSAAICASTTRFGLRESAVRS